MYTMYGRKLKTTMSMDRPTFHTAPVNTAHCKGAVIRSRYNYQTKKSDIYSVWVRSDKHEGCETQIVDNLTQKQSEYVRDAANAAIASNRPFSVGNCLRRYDAGM